MNIWMVLIPLAALAGYAAAQYGAYRFQNRGEVLVRNALIDHLPTDEWHLLNNVTLKLEKGTTQIDHILVSHYGIFVIETKHYKGWIFGDEKSKQWTQVIYQIKHRFQNPLHQNYKHIKAAQALLDFVPPEQIIGLVVFTGAAEFKANQPKGVYSLRGLVTYLQGLTEPILSQNRMQFCVGRLECNRLALTRQTDVEHQSYMAIRR